MGHLIIKTNESGYKEKREDDMVTEIIREFTAIKKTNEMTGKQVLTWARQVKAQRAHVALIEATKENKDFSAM